MSGPVLYMTLCSLLTPDLFHYVLQIGSQYGCVIVWMLSLKLNDIVPKFSYYDSYNLGGAKVAYGLLKSQLENVSDFAVKD